MSVVKIDRRDYLIAELKSWLWALVIIVVVVALASIFLDFQLAKNWLIIAAPVTITIANTITQYHIHEITIEKETNTLLIAFQSIMSGTKTQTFELDKVTATIAENTGLRRILYGSTIVKIAANNAVTFRVTTRYGFSAASLKLLVEKLRSTNIKT